MASKSGDNAGGRGLDYWRDYFRTAKSDIFDIIEYAIMVAASDCPKELKLRRERIAKVLFTCRLTRCFGCNRVELALDDDDHDDDENGDDHGSLKFKVVEFDHGGCGSKGSKVNSTRDDHDHDQGEGDDMNQMIKFSYGEAEALTNEIDEEREIVGEVLRIKKLLQNSQDESESVLFESLRRLQLMALTVDILKTTEIGKAVNGIRRHSSKQIRHLARELIDGWKIIVDEWVKATQEIAGGTPDSVNPSTVDEEEGLPSPPLDEDAFFATETMDFSQFFDGMDDDGNPRNCGEFNKNREVRRPPPSLVKQDAPKRREESPKNLTPPAKDNKVQQVRRREPVAKPSKPSNVQSGPERPLKPNGELKVWKDSKLKQKPEKPVIQRKPASQAEKLRSSDEDLVQEKLEASKRRLQERYQQAENAKRQRTIQVMELHDLPKQGLANKNTHGKFGNRHWANGRR